MDITFEFQMGQFQKGYLLYNIKSLFLLSVSSVLTNAYTVYTYV